MNRFVKHFLFPITMIALGLASLLLVLHFKHETADDLPVAFQGRFRSMKAYLKTNLGSKKWDKTNKTLFLPPVSEESFEKFFHEMEMKQISSKEIAHILENQYPLHTRLKNAGEELAVLPGKRGEWFSIRALTLSVYNPATRELAPVDNFTLFPDELFSKLQNSFFALKAAREKDEKGTERLQEKINKILLEGYFPLAGTIYKEAFGNGLSYPTFLQLKVETFYYNYPFILISIVLYTVSIILLLLGIYLHKTRFINIALVTQWSAFFFHSLVLAMRCFVLGRPPVSNMFETVIYVPWVAVMAGLLLNVFYRMSWLLVASSLASAVLLTILEITQINSGLDNVQAVLNSQYWLVIHVLMVVGSYGFFVLSGLLAHFYLLGYVYGKGETAMLANVAKALLQCMYIGTALLISGTILGGVWAAESWGRFWDWDPKEAWAFISSCVYLMGIHAYTFQHIGNFGLAITSIAGLQAITFTWYGVNYILGTGLHSYGFGSGGEIYYFSFLAAEILFLAAMLCYRQRIKQFR